MKIHMEKDAKSELFPPARKLAGIVGAGNLATRTAVLGAQPIPFQLLDEGMSAGAGGRGLHPPGPKPRPEAQAQGNHWSRVDLTSIFFARMRYLERNSLQKGIRQWTLTLDY